MGASFEVRRFLKVQSSSKEFVVQAGKGTGCKNHDPVQQALSNTPRKLILKNRGWKTILSFQNGPFFGGHVSFRVIYKISPHHKKYGYLTQRMIVVQTLFFCYGLTSRPLKGKTLANLVDWLVTIAAWSCLSNPNAKPWKPWNIPLWRGVTWVFQVLGLSFRKEFFQGGQNNQLQIGVTTPICRAISTPCYRTHLCSSMYRSYFTPFMVRAHLP